MRRLLLLIVLCVAIPAAAGPIADFDREFDSAYAAYRQALFKTNTGDAAASQKALDAFFSRWTALRSKWEKTPPPHFAEDEHWRETLSGVGDLISKAARTLKESGPAATHEVLEAVRDVVASARARNGQIRFSDRMNAYHERMEAAMSRAAKPLDAAALRSLHDDLVVLDFLATELEHGAPAAYRADAAFGEALAGLRASVAAARRAVDGADAQKAKAAVRALKKPYARMFVAWG